MRRHSRASPRPTPTAATTSCSTRPSKFVRGLQIGAAGDVANADPDYGGVGYGGPERPDLSNTSYLIDALVAAGAEPDDEAIQRALAFVSRCQNLESAGNDTPFAGKVNDGGFYYVIPTESVDPSSDEALHRQRRPAQLRLDELRRASRASSTPASPRTTRA